MRNIRHHPRKRARKRRKVRGFEPPNWALGAFVFPASVRNDEPSASVAVEERASEVTTDPPWVDAARKVLEKLSLRYHGSTLRGYRSDLALFAEFMGLALPGDGRPPEEAARAATMGAAAIIGLGPFLANEQVSAWKASMQALGLEARTINRRRAAVNSMLAIGRQIGVIDWELAAPDIQVKRISGQKGPDE